MKVSSVSALCFCCYIHIILLFHFPVAHFISAGTTAVTLGDVLSLWTGAQNIPPLGFDSNLHVDFVGGDRQLPSASTCGLVLHLWRGSADADEFSNDFTMAIQEGVVLPGVVYLAVILVYC